MTDFILPDIGEGIVECELLKWLVNEGDEVQEDQAVAEVMTDKATVEIPAMYSGIVTQLYYKEGDIAKVHEPLFALTQPDDKLTSKNGQAFQEAKQASNGHEHESQIDIDVGVNMQSNNAQIEAFILPDIGEGIVECEIMQWHISQGDSVKEDQVVVEVMTDKAVVEIPAKYDGVISKLHYAKGDIAAVHSPLFDQYVAKTTDNKKHIPTDIPKAAAVPNSDATNSKLKQGENFEAPIISDRPIASPAVRRIAQENGINLLNVQGSGSKGRVVKQDVIALINTAQLKDDMFSTNVEPYKQTQQDQTQPITAQDKVVPIKGIQAAMAKQMVASTSTIPHFTVSDELCMDKLIALRSVLKPEFAEKGIKLSFMPFFVKALSLALNQFPVINSRLNEQATELSYLGSHNIGVAVDSKMGLIVPNIKNVQNLSLFEVAQAFDELVNNAREGKLSNQDLSGGSISMSNIGALGGISATPVINKPEVAIVALGKTQVLPRFDIEGKVEAQHIMTVNWSGDHRVIDGATMVKFNNTWMDLLTHPEKMLVYLR